MISYQFIKKINETEVGNMGTNETYILVPKKIKISDIFERTNFEYDFKYKKTNNVYKLRLTVGREQRIVGLGPFYRDSNAKAGSRILIECRESRNGTKEYFLDVVTSDNSILLQVSSSLGLRILNKGINKINKEDEYKIYEHEELYPIEIKFLGKYKPRKNSKTKFDYYDLLINNRSARGRYSNDDIIEIVCRDKTCHIIDDISYQKLIIKGI